jgi:hypothetical protein
VHYLRNKILENVLFNPIFLKFFKDTLFSAYNSTAHPQAPSRTEALCERGTLRVASTAEMKRSSLNLKKKDWRAKKKLMGNLYIEEFLNSLLEICDRK